MTGHRLVTGGRLLTAFALTAAALGVAWLQPFTEAPARTPTAPAVLVAEARSIDQAERTQQALLTAEDDRLLRLVAGLRPGSAPYVATVDGTDTLVLTPRGLSYGLEDLIAHGAAEQQSGSAVLLTGNVLVAPGAGLVIEAPGTTLRLSSGDGGITTLVAWKADLTLTGADGAALTVTSWDPRSGAPDTDVTDGRPYIRTVSGEMSLSDVHVSELGFWAGRTGGVAWTGGSSGPAGGTITDSTVSHGHYGVFASETEGLQIRGSRFTSNVVDGLSLHRYTVDTTVTDSAADANGRHGISADQGSEGVTLSEVTAAVNTEYGVYFSGAPLSDGPSAGGAPLRAYGGFAMTGGELVDNGKGGIRVVDADDVSIVGAELTDNRDGVVLVDTVAPTTVAGTTITGDHRFGITATGGAATVSGNRVTGGDTAIRVRDVSATVTGNTVEGTTNHGISVVGAAVGTSVVDNTIGGRGPSGLDLNRVAPGVDVRSSGNDVDGWTTDRDNWVYWSTFIPNHPMLLLWAVVLGLPLVLGLRARRRSVPVGTSPYRDDIRRERPPARRVDLGGPVPSGGQA